MLLCVLVLSLINNLEASNVTYRRDIEGYIVGGEKTSINKYPHSAFLAITCAISGTTDTSDWICGSSIIHTSVLLTAAHCFDECSARRSRIFAAVGNEHRARGLKYRVAYFKMHDGFSAKHLRNDIAVARLRRAITLSSTANLIALSNNPPVRTRGYVTGWGLYNEQTDESSVLLKVARQTIYTVPECLKVLNTIPRGTLCAGNKKGYEYASEGDSGGALLIVVRHKYIQVGLVSYNEPMISKSIVVYTRVSFFYDWIQKEMNRVLLSSHNE